MDAESADEELVATRSWPRWLRALVVLAAAVVFGVVVQHAVTRGGGPTARSVELPVALPAPTTTSTAFPDGPAPTGRTRGCPHKVVCSRLVTQPQSLVDAILENLPATMLRRVRSIEYVSPAEHREVVWYRTLRLRSGSAQIAVEVRQPARGDRDHEEAYRIGAQRGLRVERVFFDRTVSITLSGTGSSLTLEQLRGLAADSRLVAA